MKRFLLACPILVLAVGCEPQAEGASPALSAMTSALSATPTSRRLRRADTRALRAQAKADAIHRKFLSSCFVKILRDGNAVRFFATPGNYRVGGNTRAKIGTVFHWRDRHGSVHFRLQRIEPDGVVFRYDVDGMDTYEMTIKQGQFKLPWKAAG